MASKRSCTSKRVERFIRYIKENNINNVHVLTNKGIASDVLINKLKEYVDVKFINVNNIKLIDGCTCECLVLGYGWYINKNSMHKGLILTTNPKRVFEIGLDDF